MLFSIFLTSEKQNYIKPQKLLNLLQSELFFKVPFLALANFLGTPQHILNIYMSHQRYHLHNQYSEAPNFLVFYRTICTPAPY